MWTQTNTTSACRHQEAQSALPLSISPTDREKNNVIIVNDPAAIKKDALSNKDKTETAKI